MVRTYNEAGRGARCEQIVRGGNSEEGEADRTQDGKTCRRDMRIVCWGRIDDVLNITVRRRKINSYTGDAGQREKARDREDEEEVSCSRGRWRCGLGLGLGSRVRARVGLAGCGLRRRRELRPTDQLHQLLHHARPLVARPVGRAVHLVLHQLDGVVEVQLGGQRLQDVDAVALEHVVASQHVVRIRLFQHVRILLDTSRWWCSQEGGGGGGGGGGGQGGHAVPQYASKKCTAKFWWHFFWPI